MEFLKTSQEALETCEADIKDLGRFIPSIASQRLKDIQGLVERTLLNCLSIEEIDECPENFCDTMAEFKKAFNEKKAAIDTQVETAESINNILCRGQPGCATGAKPVKGCMGCRGDTRSCRYIDRGHTKRSSSPPVSSSSSSSSTEEK